MEVSQGTNAGETLNHVGNDDTKFDAKAGDDYLKGGSGDDLFIGGAGKDVMYGGRGSDTFQFSKFAKAGDVDYILDFELGTDNLSFLAGTTITGISYGDAGASATLNQDGSVVVGLSNDSKVLDLKLTIHVVDGNKVFDQEVWLVDAVKNTNWHEDQWVNYLISKGASHNGIAIDQSFIIA